MKAEDEANATNANQAGKITKEPINQLWQNINKFQTNKKNVLSSYLPYTIAATLVFGLMALQFDIEELIGIKPSLNYAYIMLMIEGNTVAYFQTFSSPWLTYFSAFIYLIGFSLLLLGTTCVFAYKKNAKALQEFSIAFTIIYLIAYPFYILFPVSVTSNVIPTMAPLLYKMDPAILRIVQICDPTLDNCFPSLHAALSIMAMLLILTRSDNFGLKALAVFTTICIQFTILYLGIHWITDLIGGIMLALTSYYVATRHRSLIVHSSASLIKGQQDHKEFEQP